MYMHVYTHTFIYLLLENIQYLDHRTDENKASISPSVKFFASAVAERSFGRVASHTEKHNGGILD